MKVTKIFTMLRLLCAAALLMGILPAQAQSACQSRAFSSHEERVSAAYIAYYGRPADTGGLSYWAGQMTAQGGNLGAIIDAFGNSAEYRQRFGNLSNRELIRNLYQQLYGRDPDMAGWAFYEMWLDTGVQSLASIAISIMDGTQGGDTAILDNRKTVARHFITRMEALGSNAPIITDGNLLAKLIASTTASTASLESACQQADAVIQGQSTPIAVLTMQPHEQGASGSMGNLSGTASSKRYFKVNVPSGVTDLVIRTSGGTGDLDLYVNPGAKPTGATNAECHSMGQTAAEQCSFATPVTGDYFILLEGYTDYTSVTLSASWRGSGSIVVQPQLVANVVFTKELPSLVDFSIKDANTNLGQLVFGAGSTLPEGWKRDAIVYIEPNPDFPHGQFFKINSIMLSGAGDRVDVSVPALDEIFTNLNISFDRLTGVDYSLQILSNPNMKSQPVLRIKRADGQIENVQPQLSAAGEWFPKLGALKIDISEKSDKKLDGAKFSLDGLTIWQHANEKVSFSGAYEIKDLDIKYDLNISNRKIKSDLSVKYATISGVELSFDVSSDAAATEEPHIGFEAACGGKRKGLGLEVSGAEWKGDVCLGGIRLSPTPPSVAVIAGNRSIPVPISVDVFFFVGADLKMKAQANIKTIEESVVEYQLAIDTTVSSEKALRFDGQSYDGSHFRNTGEKIAPKPTVSVSGKVDGSAHIRAGLAFGLQTAGIYPLVARAYGYMSTYFEGSAEVYPGFDGVDGGECYKAGIKIGPGFTASAGASASIALPNWKKRSFGRDFQYAYKNESEIFKDEYGNCVPLGWDLEFSAKSDQKNILIENLSVKYKNLVEKPTRVEYELRKFNGLRYDLHSRSIREDTSPIIFLNVPSGDYVVKVTTTTLGMQTIGYRAVSVAPNTVALELNATPGDGYVDLSWNAIPEATEYMLHMAAGVGGPDGLPSIGTTTANQYRVSGLQNGTLYRFTARAFKGSQVIAGSGLVSATPVGGQLIAGRYLTIEGGAVIRDTVNGLEWQRCSVGQTWNGAAQRCDGTAATYNWHQATQLTAVGGFRIPTIAELKTLVYCSSGYPQLFGPLDDYASCLHNSSHPAVVQAAFPNTPSSYVWSSSPYAGDSSYVWGVTFFNGYSYQYGFLVHNRHVRLVRGGQSFASLPIRSANLASVNAASLPVKASPGVLGTALASFTGYDGAAPDAPVHSAQFDVTYNQVFFLSRATNLLPGAHGGVQHLYGFDPASRTLRRLSQAPSGEAANADTTAFSLAAEAGKLVFSTQASNLEGGAGLYLLNLDTHTRKPLLTALQHGGHDLGVDNPVLNGSGLGLAFDAPDANGRRQIFSAGLAETGLQGLQAETPLSDTTTTSCCAALSADGRYLAWQETGQDGRVRARVLVLATEAAATLEWPQTGAAQGLRMVLSADGAQLRWLAQSAGADATPMHSAANPLYVPAMPLR